jgi:hypothetical protein
MYEDHITRKKRLFSEKKKAKKQFGERATVKTTIPYAESQKCRGLGEFGVEVDDGDADTKRMENGK